MSQVTAKARDEVSSVVFRFEARVLRVNAPQLQHAVYCRSDRPTMVQDIAGKLRMLCPKQISSYYAEFLFSQALQLDLPQTGLEFVCAQQLLNFSFFKALV